MIISLFSLTESSQNIAGVAIGALVIVLLVAQFFDFAGSRFRAVAEYLKVFSTPMIILFIFIIIARVVSAIAG